MSKSMNQVQENSGGRNRLTMGMGAGFYPVA
jgi:hypothetical protein